MIRLQKIRKMVPQGALNDQIANRARKVRLDWLFK